MSAVPAFDIEARPRPASPILRPPRAGRTALAHVPRALIAPVPGIKVRTLPSLAERTALRTAWFLGIAVATYMLSALTGQVLIEQARRDAIRATARAQAATKLETAVHRRLDELMRPDRIEGWAADNKLEPGG